MRLLHSKLEGAQNMSTEEQKANLFYLTIGNDDDNESIEGRSDAVARAKSLSQETSQ